MANDKLRLSAIIPYQALVLAYTRVTPKLRTQKVSNKHKINSARTPSVAGRRSEIRTVV